MFPSQTNEKHPQRSLLWLEHSDYCRYRPRTFRPTYETSLKVRTGTFQSDLVRNVYAPSEDAASGAVSGFGALLKDTLTGRLQGVEPTTSGHLSVISLKAAEDVLSHRK